MSYSIPRSIATAVIEQAARRGWDFDALLATAGIAPSLLLSGGGEVTDAQLRRLMRAAWRMTDDDLLGFGVSPVPRGTLKMLCFAMATVPNLGDAILRFADLSRAVAGLPLVRLDSDGDDAVIRVDTTGLDDPGHARVLLTAVATHRLIAWTAGGRVRVRCIELPLPAPRDPGELNELFGETLRFDAPDLTIVLDRAALSTPVPHDESALLELLKDAPAALLTPSRRGESLTRRVERVIEKRLQRHQLPTAGELAGQLSMSEPSLRRKLRDEGTSLREVRDAILCRMAVTRLTQGAEPIAAVSESLGFSEPSAFTRAFRRWTGHPPSFYRASSVVPG